MAGHSKFKNIMHRKGAQDKKRAKVFSKLGREITVATKSGLSDPAMNPRLRTAIATAKAANMPGDRIKKAIASGSPGGDGQDYDAIRYEGYGPGGVAVIVDALTDNKNRTAAEIRFAFTKHGGALGETNAVSFMFDRVGYIAYPTSTASAEDIFEEAVEAGAENAESTDDGHEIITSTDYFITVRDTLEQKFGTAESAALIWQPKIMVAPDSDTMESVLKLIDTLEDNDDVQSVFVNLESEDED